MITEKAPDNWKDLQTQVAVILNECGFDAETEITVNTPRGDVEIDVLASETVEGRKYKIVCECKYWKSNIPQHVIHSFRTVTSETGANIGYIISKKGYQKGAFEAAKNTNLELITWEEFQDVFEQSWLKNYLSPTIIKALDPLLTYTEPLFPPWVAELSQENKEKYYNLYEQHVAFGMIVMSFAPYSRAILDRGFLELPLKNLPKADETKHIPPEIMEAVGYREFLELSISHGEKVIEEFRAIRSTVRKDINPYE